MAWLNKGPAQTPASQKAGESSFATFDLPVKIRVRGVNEPVSSTLLHVAVSGCRLRSWIMLERGTAISFDWRLSNGQLLNLAGTVAARYQPRNGGVGFEYAVALEQMPQADADALAREAAMLVRRTSNARSYDTALVDISRFTGYRVPLAFSVVYRVEDPNIPARIAQAYDVTGNALRMRCPDVFRKGQHLRLQVRLPDSVLAVHKGDADELVVGPFGYRRVPRKQLRRPFPELNLRAQVAEILSNGKEKHYELELVEMDGVAREELARYVHASQLATLKK